MTLTLSFVIYGAFTFFASFALVYSGFIIIGLVDGSTTSTLAELFAVFSIRAREGDLPPRECELAYLSATAANSCYY